MDTNVQILRSPHERAEGLGFGVDLDYFVCEKQVRQQGRWSL